MFLKCESPPVRKDMCYVAKFSKTQVQVNGCKVVERTPDALVVDARSSEQALAAFKEAEDFAVDLISQKTREWFGKDLPRTIVQSFMVSNHSKDHVVMRRSRDFCVFTKDRVRLTDEEVPLEECDLIIQPYQIKMFKSLIMIEWVAVQMRVRRVFLNLKNLVIEDSSDSEPDEFMR